MRMQFRELLCMDQGMARVGGLGGMGALGGLGGSLRSQFMETEAFQVSVGWGGDPFPMTLTFVRPWSWRHPVWR